MKELRAIYSLVVFDYAERKIKKAFEDAGLDFSNFEKLFEKEIKDITNYVLNKIEGNLRLEQFNKSNLDKLFSEAFMRNVESLLSSLPDAIKRDNLLIEKLREYSSSNNEKAMLYYIIVKKLLEVPIQKEQKEVIIT